MRVLCFGVVLDGITTVPAGILNRLFLQRRRFACDVLTFVVGTGLTIMLAAAGAGAASFLAIGRLTGNVVMLLAITVVTPIRVWPGWDRRQAAALLRFGLPLAGSSLLMLAVSNVDNIVVGAVVGPVGLGLYLMAFNASSWPLTVFSDAARRVSLAGFSRLTEDPPALRRAFVRGLALLVAAVVPVCIGIAAFAEPLLRVMYGSQWAPAATALSWLAVLGLARVVLFVCYDLIVAVGQTRRLIGLPGAVAGNVDPGAGLGGPPGRHPGCRDRARGGRGRVVTPAFGLTLFRLGIGPVAVLRGCFRPVAGGVLALAACWVVHQLVAGDLPRLVLGAVAVLAVYLPVVAPMRALLPSSRAGRHRLAVDGLGPEHMVPVGPLLVAAGAEPIRVRVAPAGAAPPAPLPRPMPGHRDPRAGGPFRLHRGPGEGRGLRPGRADGPAAAGRGATGRPAHGVTAAAAAKRAIRSSIGLWRLREVGNRVVLGPRQPAWRRFEDAEVARLRPAEPRPALRVATVVPTYRRPGSVVRAVESALAQTVTEQTVVVVDDGGGLPPMPSDPRLLAVSLRRNTGIAGLVRNVGIRITGSAMIAFLDDDNEWRPDHLEVALRALEGRTVGPADLVYTALSGGLPDGTPLDVLGVPFDRRSLSDRSYVDTNALVLRRTPRVRFSVLPRRRTTLPREDWEFCSG